MDCEAERVCCMCGDVGFPDQIFRCINCHHRFQHSYCSNSYSESSEPTQLCNWCQTTVEKKTSKQQHHAADLAKKPTSKLDTGISNRAQYSGDHKMKQQERDEATNSEKGKSPTGVPSPRTRRYKLLKDVMC